MISSSGETGMFGAVQGTMGGDWIFGISCWLCWSVSWQVVCWRSWCW